MPTVVHLDVERNHHKKPADIGTVAREPAERLPNSRFPCQSTIDKASDSPILRAAREQV